MGAAKRASPQQISQYTHDSTGDNDVHLQPVQKGHKKTEPETGNIIHISIIFSVDNDQSRKY